MKSHHADTRSPLKDKPLRLPGQSLQEERDAIWEDRVEPYALIALVLLAGLEWWRAWTRSPPTPGLFTIVAVIAVVIAAYRVWRWLPRVRALRQGIAGERAVGQFLERLREQGYHVFHDVVGPSFNVDHVIIGAAGIFTIETKTWSKPAHGDARVTAEGDLLLVDGRKPDRDPVTQARAQARWLHQRLHESTGKPFPVRPVIAFPGWFIDPSAQSLSNLWVLEPKALPRFLEQEPERVDRGDVALASFHLSRMIRDGERR